MKKTIVYSLFFFCSCFCQYDDSIVYRKAYEYILSSQVIEKAFDTTVCGICTSEEVIKQSLNAFSKEIVEYEYGNLDQKQKDSIESELIKQYRSEKRLVVQYEPELKNIQTCDSCNFIAFFF